jgi:hypothetical protein
MPLDVILSVARAEAREWPIGSIICCFIELTQHYRDDFRIERIGVTAQECGSVPAVLPLALPLAIDTYIYLSSPDF